MSADIIQALQFVFSSRYETDPAGAKAFSKETQAIIKGAEDVAEALKGSGTDITKRLEMISTAVKDTAKQLSKAEFTKHTAFSGLIDEEAKKLNISGKNLIAAKQNIIKNFLSGDDRALQSSKLGKAFFENFKNIDKEWDAISAGYQSQAQKLINTVIKSNQKTDAALKAVVDSRAKWEYNIAKQSRQLDTAQQDSYKTSLDSIFKEIEKRRISAKEAEKRLQELSRQIEIDLSQQTASISSAKTQTGGFQTEAKAKDLGSKLSKAASDSTSIITKQIASDMITTINEMVEGFKDGRLSLVQFNNEFQKTNVEAQELLRNHKSITAEQKEQEKETLNENKLLEKINTTIKDVRESWQKVAQFDEMKHLTALVNAQLEEMAALTNRIGNEDMGILNSDLKQINNELDSINNSYIELSKRKKIIGKKEATDLRIRELTTGPVAFNINDEKIQNVRKLFDDLYASQNLTSKSTKQLDDEFSHLKNTITELKIEKGNMMQADSEERRGINDLRMSMHELQGSLYAVQYATQAVFGVIKDVVVSSMNTFGKFEEELNRFAAVSYKAGDSMMTTENNMRKFGEEAIRVALNSKLLITDVEKAGVVLAKMGFSAQEATGMLKTIVLAAEASGESITKVATTIANISAAYGKQAGELAQPVEHIADVVTRIALETKADIEEIGTSFKYLGAIAEETGQDFHTVGAMLEIVGKHGIVGSQAGTSIRQILLSLVKDTPDATAAMKTLGVTATENNGKIKDAAVFLKEYAAAMKGLSSSAKAKASEDIFVTTALPSAMALVSELEQNENALTNTIKAQRDEVKGLTQDMKNLQFKGYNAELAEMKSRVEGLALAFGKDLEPAALALVRTLAKLITFLNDLSPGLKQLLVGTTLVMGGISALTIGLTGFLIVVSQVGIGIATVKDLFLKFAPAAASAGAAASSTASIWSKVFSVFGNILGVLGGLVTGFSSVREGAEALSQTRVTENMEEWYVAASKIVKVFGFLVASVSLALFTMGPMGAVITGIGIALGAAGAFWWEHEKAVKADADAMQAANDTIAIRLSTQGAMASLLKKEANGAHLTADEYYRLAHAMSQAGVGARAATQKRIAGAEKELADLIKNGVVSSESQGSISGYSGRDRLRAYIAEQKQLEKYQAENQLKNISKAGEFRAKGDIESRGTKYLDDSVKLYQEIIGLSGKLANSEEISNIERTKMQEQLNKKLKEYQKSIDDIDHRLIAGEINSKQAKDLKKDQEQMAAKIKAEIELNSAKTRGKDKQVDLDGKLIEGINAQTALRQKQNDIIKMQNDLLKQQIDLSEKDLAIEKLKFKIEQAGGQAPDIGTAPSGGASGIDFKTKSLNAEADKVVEAARRTNDIAGYCFRGVSNALDAAWGAAEGGTAIFTKGAHDFAWQARDLLAQSSKYMEVAYDKSKPFWEQIKAGDIGVLQANSGLQGYSARAGHIETFDPEKKMAHYGQHQKISGGREYEMKSGLMKLYRLRSWIDNKEASSSEQKSKASKSEIKNTNKLEKQQNALEKFDQARLDIISKRYKLTLGEIGAVQEMLAKEEAALPGAKAKLEEVKARSPQKVTGTFKTEQDYLDAVDKARLDQENQITKAEQAVSNIEKNIHELKLQEGKLSGETKDHIRESLELTLEKQQREKDQNKSNISFMQEMISMRAKMLDLSYRQIDAAELEHEINLMNIDATEKEAWEQEQVLFGLKKEDFEYSKAHQKALKQREIENAQYYQNLEKTHQEWVNWNFELDTQMAEMKANSVSDDIKRIEALAAVETEKRKKKLADDLDAAKKKQNSDLEQQKIQENFNREQLIADRNTKFQILKSLDEITQKRYEALQQQISIQSKLGADIIEASSLDRRRSTVGNIKESIEAYDQLANSIKQPLMITNKMLDEQIDGLNEINKLRQQQLFVINDEILAARLAGKPQSEINDLVAKRTSLQLDLNKSQSLAHDLSQKSVKDFIMINQQAKLTKQIMTDVGTSLESFTGGLGKMIDAMNGGESTFSSFFSNLNEGWKSATDLTEQFVLAIGKVSAATEAKTNKVNLPWTDSQKAMQTEDRDSGLLGLITGNWLKSGKKNKKIVKGKGWDAFGGASAQAQGASGASGGKQAGDIMSTIGGVASAVIPVAGTVMSIIGGAIGFFGEMDKKKKELEKELAVSRADLLAAEAEFLDKRADIFFEKGDISAALYQENKIIAARKKFQAELDKTNIEIREQEEKAKPGWFGFMGEEQKIAQAKADQLKMQKATKFEELPQQMRDVEAEAAKKSVERENELLDANVRVRKVKAELYGDSIGLIQIEAEEKNNALNKELELGYIEQKRLGYTEQANKKVLELERAILQERMKLNSQTQLSIKLEGQRLLMTSEQIKNRSAENLNPYAKGELTKSQENLRLEDAQREVDLMKEYAEWQGKAQAHADKGQAIPSYILDAVTASKAELDDIINARKKGGLSTKSQATLDEQRKVQESNLYKMGNEVERINAQLRDDQFKQAELDELDALRDLEDAKRQESAKYDKKDDINQGKVNKSFAAKEEKIRRDTAERKVQIEMDWRKRVRDLSASEAANTSDDLDDIKIAYANTSAEIADEWGKAKQFMSGDKLAQREKELLSQQLAANISYFNALADLRKRDLDEIIELDNLKAQNTRDSLNIAVTDYQGQMQQIMYDEAVALERYKDNEAKKAYYTEYYEEKKKNIKINAEKSVADAAIDQLNKLSQVKELQFELEMRVYEKEIKANERKISDLQRKIDKLERDKAKIEREIDEAQRKFKVEDKGKFRDALGGINIDQTLRDALEYISNPTANQTKDAAMETAMDAVKTQVDYLKSKAESAYALEDIDATEYYRQMISAVLQQAKAAQYALANLDTEQEAEMQRYILAGKNEDELRVVRKHHMLERMKMEGMYSDAYKDYQKLNDEALEVTRKEEIEAIDEKIDKEKRAVEDLQWINEDKKRIIEDARFKMEEVTDKIKEKVQDLTLATGNWGFSLEDAKKDAMGVFDAIITGYDAAKAKLQEVLTLKVDAPILDLLAKITGTDFSKMATGSQSQQSSGLTVDQRIANSEITGLKPVANYFSGQTTSPYVGKNGYEFNAPLDKIASRTEPSAEFFLQGWNTGRWYNNFTDMNRAESANQALGAAEGRQPMKHTGNGSARPGDYLPAMVKNNEWIVPDDKMREMARGMVKDAFGGRAMTGGDTTFNMSFGNVYGVDDLKGTINEAIRKANMDDGYHNSVYLVGNN